MVFWHVLHNNDAVNTNNYFLPATGLILVSIDLGSHGRGKTNKPTDGLDLIQLQLHLHHYLRLGMALNEPERFVSVREDQHLWCYFYHDNYPVYVGSWSICTNQIKLRVCRVFGH